MQFDAKTKEGERIYCVEGYVELRYPERRQDLKEQRQ